MEAQNTILLRPKYNSLKDNWTIEKKKADNSEKWQRFGVFDYMDKSWADLVIYLVTQRFPNYCVWDVEFN